MVAEEVAVVLAAAALDAVGAAVGVGVGPQELLLCLTW
jgi:hypothetical protein